MQGQDPFGFETTPGGSGGPRYSPRPYTVVARPGEEIRVVVSDESGAVPGLPGDSRASPKGSGDSRASPKGSGDSRASPKGSGDSRASPKGSGDWREQDAFRFESGGYQYSPRPMTVIAQPGQEIRVIVPDEWGGLPGMDGLPGDSRASPKGSGDSRSSPKGSGDAR